MSYTFVNSILQMYILCHAEGGALSSRAEGEAQTLSNTPEHAAWEREERRYEKQRRWEQPMKNTTPARENYDASCGRRKAEAAAKRNQAAAAENVTKQRRRIKPRCQ